MRGIIGHLLRSIGGAAAAAGSVPSAPDITALVDNGDGTVTATIDGDVAVTNYLYYGRPGQALTQGQSRSGDGDITQTISTTELAYVFVAISKSGDYWSPPSDIWTLYVTDGSTQHVYEILSVRDVDERKTLMEVLAVERP